MTPHIEKSVVKTAQQEMWLVGGDVVNNKATMDGVLPFEVEHTQ